MTDIVERLCTENTLTGYYGPPQLQADAADEIERLRAALREIAEMGAPAECERIARAALKEDRHG